MPSRLIIIILILAAAFVFGFFGVLPKYRDFQTASANLKQKELELNSKTAYYAEIKKIGGKLEEHKDALAKIDSALPGGYSIPVLFNYLQQAAGGTGLVLEDLTFGGVAGDKVKEISINLQVEGSYLSLKSFLSALEGSARFFKVKNIKFSSPEKGSSFSFDLAIATYSY